MIPDWVITPGVKHPTRRAVGAQKFIDENRIVVACGIPLWFPELCPWTPGLGRLIPGPSRAMVAAAWSCVSCAVRVVPRREDILPEAGNVHATRHAKMVGLAQNRLGFEEVVGPAAIGVELPILTAQAREIGAAHPAQHHGIAIVPGAIIRDCVGVGIAAI